VIAVCGLAIAGGTATGGWRIIQTLGRRITEIESSQGFAAETVSTAIIPSAAHLGFALSTTQVTSGARLRLGRWASRGSRAVAGGGPHGRRLVADAAGRRGRRRAGRWVAARGPAGTVLVGALLVVVAGSSTPRPVQAGHRGHRQRRASPAAGGRRRPWTA
jgi:PiT family inorganic phosphate transporter